MHNYRILFYFLVPFFYFPTSAALQKVTVLLDWQLSPVHAPLILAKHLGFYKQVGLDCMFITPSNPSDQPKMVAAKKVDFALYSPDKTLKAIEDGLPIRHCGTLIKSPLAALAVLKNSPIQHIEDLKGKTIGRTGSSKSLNLSTILQHHGLKIDDVKLVQLQYGLAPALATKSVDAVMIFRNVEPLQLKRMGLETRLFPCEAHGMPDHEALIFICHRDFPKSLQPFVQATNRALESIRNHPDNAWKKIKSYNNTLEKPLNYDIWKITKDLFPYTIQERSDNKLLKYIGFLKQNMYLSKVIRPNDYSIY